MELPENPATATEQLLAIVRSGSGGERVAAIRSDLQETMDANMQVFRSEETIREALDVIEKLRERYHNVQIQDKGKRFNLDLLEAVELGFLLDMAEVMTVSALHRQESRGGHYREDFPDRDDDKFMLHSMLYKDPEAEMEGIKGIRFDTKPVTFTRYEPMERKY